MLPCKQSIGSVRKGPNKALQTDERHASVSSYLFKGNPAPLAAERQNRRLAKLTTSQEGKVMIKSIPYALLCLGILTALVNAASPFDGKWSGTLQPMDRGNCRSSPSGSRVQDMVIEDGKIQQYDFPTKGGRLPLAGGFEQDGMFSIRGSAPFKGTVVFSGKAVANKLAGRWSFEIDNVNCTGPFEFNRQ